MTLALYIAAWLLLLVIAFLGSIVTKGRVQRAFKVLLRVVSANVLKGPSNDWM